METAGGDMTMLMERMTTIPVVQAVIRTGKEYSHVQYFFCCRASVRQLVVS